MAPGVTVHRHEVEPEGGGTGGTPRIAVLVSLNFPDLTEPVADLVRRFTGTTLTTLRDLGAGYELYDTSDTGALPDPATVAGLDGLLLLGGGDVDGELYGHTGPVPNSYGVDRKADDYSIAAIRAAEQAGRPVFGICRGSQLINVAFGGTLVPDLEDYRLHRGGPGEPMFLDEQVTLLKGTRVAAMAGEHRVTVRSGHHQAVDKPGEGLVVAARADDGTVEGVEHPEKWIVGVQWHPEDPDGSAEHRTRLFTSFLTACRPN
ncbi:gamma-glutamyl-gamma-aminobutyrate hydrolase family protein [Streptomyces sp. LB8]|uniref:gamma-glutamyl-gamma-aminobutyrate hydrolase family protein n=1 Tax=Streptomyces sp. LB8 TaxID=3042509 RepID=UPI00264776C4|nr:gamma-glutamyl-gamma-aminobutyrate hydrolase family protein [Streptomyces sp. LB8]MDN5382544.1 gamma-glutamyl-gamma-aminobutyrate hydrolase family protein [Streptomyces sp. LB8]